MTKTNINMRKAVLEIVPRLAPTADTKSIFEEVRKKGSLLNHMGYVYSVLAKLENEGLLWSWMEVEPRKEQGGRRRRLYGITARGHEFIAQSEAEYGDNAS